MRLRPGLYPGASWESVQHSPHLAGFKGKERGKRVKGGSEEGPGRRKVASWPCGGWIDVSVVVVVADMQLFRYQLWTAAKYESAPTMTSSSMTETMMVASTTYGRLRSPSSLASVRRSTALGAGKLAASWPPVSTSRRWSR